MVYEFALSETTLPAGVKLSAKPLAPARDLVDAVSSKGVLHDEIRKVEVPVVQATARWDRASKARDQVRQAGAICLRKRTISGTIEILLIRSFRNGSWGIPKGHIEPGETSYEAALREAFEEAGIRGETNSEAIDSFTYRKGGQFLYHVAVHVIHVNDVEEDFPEKQIRQAKWVPLRAANRYVGQEGLARILRDLALPLANNAIIGSTA